MNESWRVWDNKLSYGEVLYQRAVGLLPEMESSKKMALEIKKVYQAGNKVADVGCGAGHYLRSLRREINQGLLYTGMDATRQYIDLAREAFKDDSNAEFKVSDIYHLDATDSCYDIVMCNNLLHHLPSIKIPLAELIRIGKKFVFIRFLCGERSFRIKDIDLANEEYDEHGEPLNFYYFNIYSKSYVETLFKNQTKILKWQIDEDKSFDKEKIIDSIEDSKDNYNATRILGDYQVNGYIIQPWSILRIELKPE